MSDINSNTQQAQPTQSTQAAEPVTSQVPAQFNKQSILAAKEKIREMPDAINTAIQEGKGNDVISAFQDMLRKSIGAVFSSCRVLVLQQLLLDKSVKTKQTHISYILATILCAVLLILSFISFEWENIIFIVVILLSAVITDKILSASVTPKKSKSKNKTVNKDDDIIL